MTTKELLEQRAGLILAAQKLMDESDERGLTPEDEQTFDRLMADADALTARMNNAKRREAVDAAAADLEKPMR